MKFISWNVNGYRAAVRKGFKDYFKSADADIFCIQETKMQPGQADMSEDGYYLNLNSAERKGYSGTAIWSKEKPLAVSFGANGKQLEEGRIITEEFENFFFVDAYVPNAQPELKRIDYRMQFEDDIRNHLLELDSKKPVIYCGDMNVAHNEIDLKNPAANRGNAGFSDEERGKMTELLNSGFVDVFRYLYPDKKDAYTWWSYRMRSRERNAGWRIDYFIVSKRLCDKISNFIIHNEVLGSDHCPIELDIK